MARPKKNQRVVCISLRADGTLRVEPDPVRVKVGHRVRWVTIVRDTKKIEVSFSGRSGTPFREGRSVAEHGQLLSPAVAEHAKGKRYKYTVSLHVGKHVFKLDPEVEVER